MNRDFDSVIERPSDHPSGISRALVVVLLLIIIFIGAYKLSWNVIDTRLASEPEGAFVHLVYTKVRAFACHEFDYQKVCDVPVESAQGETTDTLPSGKLRKYFASLPDLGAALSVLKWQGGDEAEAARFLSVVQAVVLGRQRESHRVTEKMKPLLSEVWQAYPEISTASICTYCGSMSNVMRHFAKTRGVDNELGIKWASANPVYFELLSQNGNLTPQQEQQFAYTFAQFDAAGDASTARKIGNILIKHQYYDELLLWVSRGLNGGRALDEVSDLSTVPGHIVKAAWEHGVSLGQDTVRLTEYLFKKGHRPALRWVVWVQDGAAPYISSENHTYKYNRGTYYDLLEGFTDFPVKAGPQLGKYYSTHWRGVAWNREAGQWRSVR